MMNQINLYSQFLVVLLLIFVDEGSGCAGYDPNSLLSTTTQQPITTPLTTPLTTPVATTEDPVAAQCKALATDFGSGNAGGWTGDKWLLSNKPLNNKDTGIRGPDTGKAKYLGTSLEAGEHADIKSADVVITEPTFLQVKYYEATHNIVLLGCSNDASTNCKPISNKGIAKDDLQWKQGSYELTPDTKKVFLVAKNEGTNTGAVGIDSIGLSSSADGANKCPSNSSGTFEF